jgi:hypothetical protein
MQITKDEARILSAALEVYKYEHVNLTFNWYEMLTSLENKLQTYSKDNRRTGRTTHNDYLDCAKRLVKKYNK